MATRGNGTARTNDEMSSQTIALLLAAAVKLFSAQGYQSTSLQQIADEAGLTKGALYHHFRTKEDVLRRVHDDMIVEVIAASRPVMDAGLPADQALREMIRVHLRVIDTHGDAIGVFLRERRAFGPENWSEIKAKRDVIEDMFVQIITEGQRGGVFALDADPRLLAFGVLGMISWATEWFRPGKVPARKIADMYADMVLAGLVAGTPPVQQEKRRRGRAASS
jgi:TetR/AcrR family transcriptional regulator, cholesterol catabolism regulator